MAIVKCKNGHFFDNNKYASCPYCVKLENERNRYEEQMRDQITVMMPKREFTENPEYRLQSEDVTVGLYETPAGDDQKTIGAFGKQSGRNFVTGWLVCTKGRERGRDYRIYNGNNWIGRGYQMDICIVDDPAISRERHAVLIYDHKSNKFFLSPGSGTITMINHEMLVKAKELKSRDRITLGESEFTFVPFCTEGETWEKEE